MRFLRALLLLYTFLFHIVLVLAALAVSTLVRTSNLAGGFRLSFMPFHGEELTNVLFYSAIIGLVVILLGVTRIFRYAFPVWALIVLVQMVRWFVLGSATFANMAEFRGAMWLIVGAFGAFLSSLIVLRSPERSERR